MLEALDKEHHLIQNILYDLTDYCTRANIRLKQEPQLLKEDRTTMKLTARN